MIPAKGGDPTPEAPIVLGRNEPGGEGACIDIAKKHYLALCTYRDAGEDDPHKGTKNMSQSQRRAFKHEIELWHYRSEGKDATYLRSGTFPWNERRKDYPTEQDRTVEKLRRADPEGYKRSKLIKLVQDRIGKKFSTYYPRYLRKKHLAREKLQQDFDKITPFPIFTEKESAMMKAANKIKKEELAGDKAHMDDPED
jgi:hypothetical protein